MIKICLNKTAYTMNKNFHFISKYHLEFTSNFLHKLYYEIFTSNAAARIDLNMKLSV